MQEQKILLKFAHDSIEHYLQNNAYLKLIDNHEKFLSPIGSFVTLYLNNELRGCLGVIETKESLIKNIQENAIASATQDLRFFPITLNELKNTKIEISVLSIPQLSDYENINENQDGVIVKLNNHQATYLPQVWKNFQNKRQFFQELCLKAGLAADSYQSSDCKILKYQAQVFSTL